MPPLHLNRTLLLLALTAPLAWAQTPIPAGLEIGFEERIRSEDWDNLLDHTDSKADYRSQYRFRTRLWAQYSNGKNFEIVGGLLNENRKITRPETTIYNGREIIFETLYADYRPTPAFSVRVGRQNLMRGEGFVLFDGSPGDGSRSQYFNAVDVAWTTGKSRLEFLVISNPQKDRYLPVMNKIETPAEMNRLIEWDEQALGLYLTHSGSTVGLAEAYYFFKTERNFDRTNRAIYQPDRSFSTLGGRLLKNFEGGWTASGELAGQWGRQDAPDTAPPGDPGKNIHAWGGYTRLKKTFGGSWTPRASIGYIGLSGQDPNRSDQITAWNPVFGRWPKWSELFIYTQAPEKGVAYWTNTGMWELEFRCTPLPKFDLRATYYSLSALQPLAPQTGTTFSTGKKRGDLWQVRADFTFSPYLKSHVVYEHLQPGNAYIGHDPGHYLRCEITYLFKQRL